MRESQIENSNREYAKKLNLLFEKFTSPNRRSVPDRIVSPGGGSLWFPIYFIEYKATGKDATTLQKKDHERRRKGGTVVFVVDDIQEGERILAWMVNHRHITPDGYDSMGRRL